MFTYIKAKRPFLPSPPIILVMKAGFIGTGMMGFPMAKRLIEAGHEVIVWNRTRSKAEPLAKLGAKLAQSPREVAEEANVIHVMVADDNASRAVLAGPNGVSEAGLEGKIVVNHSTVTPMHTLDMEKLFTSLGAEYLAVPVMGGPRDAEKGMLLAMAGGREEALRRARPLILTFAKEIIYLGAPHVAAAVKLAINSLFFSSAAALSEAIALVEAWGASHEELYRVARRLWLRSLIDKYGERLLDEEYPVSFRLVLAAKDLEYAARSGFERGQPMPLASGLAELFLLAAKEGLGEEDYSRIAKFIRNVHKK